MDAATKGDGLTALAVEELAADKSFAKLANAYRSFLALGEKNAIGGYLELPNSLSKKRC